MVAVLRSCGASIIASWVLAGGVLTGKYATPGASGRVANELDSPRLQPAITASGDLRSLASSVGATPAALAIAFALAKPSVASVLFGATHPDQVAENLRAWDLLGKLSQAQLDELEQIGADSRRG